VTNDRGHRSIYNCLSSRALIGGQMIENYLKRLRTRRLSPQSIAQYRMELRTLERLGRDTDKIEAYLSGCEASSHHKKLSIWKCYLESTGDTLLKDFELPRVPKKVVSFLTVKEIESVEAYAQKFLRYEDQIFLEIALNLGLRISEVLGITAKDIDGDYVAVTRKGGDQQRLPLPDNLRVKLEGFAGFTRSKRYFQRLMHKIEEALGFKKNITPHTLRHSFASRAIQEGNDVLSIKEFLGHASLGTTQRYLHAAPEHLRQVIVRRNSSEKEK
jgi:site-specific recombinase XerD